MNSYNKFIGLGNLTRDPETRYTPSGTAICTFGIAMNHKYKQGDETKDEVCYLDVIVFGKYADVCQKYLTKGQGVLVEGRIRQRRWSEKESGAPRAKHELIASAVNFMPKKQGEAAGSQYPIEEPPMDEGPIPF
jgi:single-strand DNA-binding protein